MQWKQVFTMSSFIICIYFLILRYILTCIYRIVGWYDIVKNKIIILINHYCKSLCQKSSYQYYNCIFYFFLTVTFWISSWGRIQNQLINYYKVQVRCLRVFLKKKITEFCIENIYTGIQLKRYIWKLIKIK